MGCVNVKEETDDDGHLVDGDRSKCSSCFSNSAACRSCSGVVRTCAIQTCSDCSEVHCSNCLQCDSSRQSSGLVCSKCLVLSSGQFMPQDLSTYSIHELRQFLFRKEIAADHCKERSDLIELVMLLSCSSEYLSIIDEHSQHVQMLRERMEQFSDGQNASSELQNDVSSTDYNEHCIGAVKSVSIDRTYSPGNDKHASVENTDLESAKENRSDSPTANDVSRDFCDSDCIEVEIEDAQLAQTGNVSIEENAKTTTELETTDCLTNEIEFSRVANDIGRQQGATIEDSGNRGKNTVDRLCLLCSRTNTDCVFLECGHMVTCYSCGELVDECPICFNYITRRVRAFRA